MFPYTIGAALSPQTEHGPDLTPSTPETPEIGAIILHQFFLKCCPQAYMLQASGSTLGSAMTPALSFVMTRASSWLGPVAVRAASCCLRWPAFEHIL